MLFLLLLVRAGQSGRNRDWLFAGLSLGVLGIAILVGPERMAGGERVDVVASLALVCSSYCSVVVVRAPPCDDPCVTVLTGTG